MDMILGNFASDNNVEKPVKKPYEKFLISGRNVEKYRKALHKVIHRHQWTKLYTKTYPLWKGGTLLKK